MKLKGLPEVTTAALLVLGIQQQICNHTNGKKYMCGNSSRNRWLPAKDVKQLFPPAKDDALLYALGALMNLVGTVRDATIVNEEDADARLIGTTSASAASRSSRPSPSARCKTFRRHCVASFRSVTRQKSLQGQPPRGRHRAAGGLSPRRAALIMGPRAAQD